MKKKNEERRKQKGWKGGRKVEERQRSKAL